MEVTRKPHLHQDWIDSHAYGIVKALQKGGFTTYLVGGCVRDLLLGIEPKDYDIATMAHPPQVKRMIYMSFIIGKRFRLVLVKRDQQQFEVATFRREVKAEDFPEGVPAGDNVFGTPEEDARRRDFTINGLFYDPISEQLIDYVQGLPDIEARVMRMIGDPDIRLIEDPIRILRCLRLSHKLGFTIEPGLRASMVKNASELQKSVLPRKREEILKILRLNEPDLALMECFDLELLKMFIPTLHDLLSEGERRDLFLAHFAIYRALVKDANDPTQLFTWLVYSMLKAAETWHEKRKAAGLPSGRETPVTIHDEIFENLMQEELGMYRFEQSVLTHAIELLPILSRVEDFKRRGERRQLGLMRNEGFQLALKIAEADLLLSSEELDFWYRALERLTPELQALRAEQSRDTEGKGKRRRTRRKRGSSEARVSSIAADDTADAADDNDDRADGESDDADDADDAATSEPNVGAKTGPP